MSQNLHLNVLLDGEIHEAEIVFDKKIISVKKLGKQNKSMNTLIPGFIDLHVHGGGGADIMEGENSLACVAQTHAKFGTTSMLATTVTAEFNELKKVFTALKNNIDVKNGAKILGVHLEGPFINAEKLGAQPAFTRKGTLSEIKTLNEIVPIKIITLAPELNNNLELISELNELKIVTQIGHSNGTYEEGVLALKSGAKSFTHLYNAMSGFHHRTPGMVGAALAHAEYSEIIPDLLHVHPGAIKVALRSIPKVYFVSDATSATGMPDGDYKLGTHVVHKCLGGVRLADGTLAGSALTMDQAFKNLIQLGLSISEVSMRMSQIPAELIGLSDRGKIQLDYFSDFIIINSKNNIEAVYLEGECL